MTLLNVLHCIFWNLATGFQIHAPENIATVAGNPVTMSCGTDDNRSFILWHFQSAFDSQEMLIFNSNIGFSRFAISKNNFGFYQMRIENVTAFDAGIYRCLVRRHVRGGTEKIAEFKSDLIVLESHPSCNTNASSVKYEGHVDDILLLHCTVDYTGYWSPYMEWSRLDGMNITTMFTNIQHNGTITSTLTLHLNPGDNGVTFSCKTGFSKSTNMEITEVRNVPTYQFIWKYTTNVLFGPQKIEITPYAEYYSPNDRLYCAADGNPNPSCTWIDLDANKEVAKVCLLLLKEKLDAVYNYQCTAENTIVGVRNFKSINITYRIIDSSTLHQYSIIGGAVGIAAGSILISVIVTSIRKRLKRKCRENRSKDNSTEAPSSPHDYDSISDADNQMNQLGNDPVTVIENVEVGDINEEDEEEAGQEVEVDTNTHRTPAIDTVNDSSHESHSRLVISGTYSSLKDRQRTHHHPTVGDLYSQLDAHAATAAEVNERGEQNDIVPGIPHSYYNLP